MSCHVKVSNVPESSSSDGTLFCEVITELRTPWNSLKTVRAFSANKTETIETRHELFTGKSSAT